MSSNKTNKPKVLSFPALLEQDARPWEGITKPEIIEIRNATPSARADEARQILTNLVAQPTHDSLHQFGRLTAILDSAPLIRDTISIEATNSKEQRRVLHEALRTAPQESKATLAATLAVAEYASGHPQTAKSLAATIPDTSPTAGIKTTVLDAINNNVTTATMRSLLSETAANLPAKYAQADALHTKAQSIRASFPTTGRNTTTETTQKPKDQPGKENDTGQEK